MNTGSHSQITIGIPSLLLIFTVLTMVSLALMTLGNSRSDLAASNAALSQTSAYYDACSKACDLYDQAADYIREALADASSETAFYEKMKGISEAVPEISFEDSEHVLGYEVPFSEGQSISVKLSCAYEQADRQPAVLSWTTVVTEDWTPDTQLNLYSGTFDSTQKGE